MGASDTLPANFRVTSSSAASPSTQPKRSPMDGKQREQCQCAHGVCETLCRCLTSPHVHSLLFGWLCDDAVTNGMSLHVISAYVEIQEVSLYRGWTLPQSGPTLVNTQR